MPNNTSSQFFYQQKDISLPLFQSIPKTLTLYPNWCQFTYEETDNGYKAIPIGEIGVLNDIYRQAFDDERPDLGIAFVLTNSQPIIAIDLIGCLNGNEQMDDWAADIHEQLSSYTQVLDQNSIRILVVSHLDTNRQFDHIQIHTTDMLIPLMDNAYGEPVDLARREAEINMIVSLHTRRTWPETLQDALGSSEDELNTISRVLGECLNRDGWSDNPGDTGLFPFLAICWQHAELRLQIRERIESELWSRGRREDFIACIESAIPAKPKPTTSIENTDNTDLDSLLQYSKSTRMPKENFYNLVKILKVHEKWSGRLRFDTMKNAVMVDDEELSDFITGKAVEWFGDTYGFGGNTVSIYARALYSVACEDSYDALTEWILNLKAWDGIPRLKSWMIDYCGSPEGELTEWISYVTIMQMIARGLNPGCMARLVPIWEGTQNKGKTSAIMELGHPWSMTFSMSMDNKEAHMAIQGVWVAELDELDTMRKTTETHLKSFISQKYDSFVPKYLNFRVQYPRRTVFFGTTNEEQYLRDETGATRFLPIKTGEFDIEGIISVREQLFAEARDLLLTTPDLKWWLEPGSIQEELEDQRENRRITNLYTEDICKWLDGELPNSIYRIKVTWREIASEYLKIESPDRWNNTSLQMRVYHAMRQNGWQRARSKKEKFWSRTSSSEPAKDAPF